VAGQGGEDFPQAGLVVGQCLVEELLSRPIQGHGVVTGFPTSKPVNTSTSC